MSKKDAYVEKAKAQLDTWNAEIEELQTRARKADPDAKIKYEKQIDELRGKQKELGHRLAEIEKASDHAWEDLKQGLENSWEILKKSLTKAKTEFERGYREGRED
jgi:septal ring factor EnvC (AmiA/AmiB activator)